MRYKKLIYKRKYSIFGIMLFLLIGSIDISFKILKYMIIRMIDLGKWIVRYVHFVKSGYSYNEIYNIILEMKSREFEFFICELFKYSGFRAEVTEATCDGGKDVVVEDSKGQVIYIETKRWKPDLEVGRVVLQKLVGAMVADQADKAILVCTCKFNNNAYEYASKVNNLMLMDINDIMKMVAKIDQRYIPRILTKSLGTTAKIVRLQPSIER